MLVAVQAGFRTRHITTAAITAVWKKATHATNLHESEYIVSSSNLLHRLTTLVLK